MSITPDEAAYEEWYGQLADEISKQAIETGSDAESLERARQLLAHADAKVTQQVYRRKPEVVKPLR